MTGYRPAPRPPLDTQDRITRIWAPWTESPPATDRDAHEGKWGEAAQRYARWSRSINGPAGPVHSLRISTEGHFKLDTRWRTFCGEHVVSPQHGFVFQAEVELDDVVVIGHDAYVDGIGVMDWRLFGRLPALLNEGDEVSRSFIARQAAFLVLVPGAPLFWGSMGEAIDDSSFAVDIRVGAGVETATLTIDSTGAPEAVWVERYGNPNGEYGLFPYGVEVSWAGAAPWPDSLRASWLVGDEPTPYLEARVVRGEMLEASGEPAQ